MTTATTALYSPCAENARTALAVGSVLSALGALGYISIIIFAPDVSPRDAYAMPLNMVSCAVATVGVLLILYALLHARIIGPGWPLLVSSAGLFFAAANAWFLGTGIVAVTEFTTDDQFDDIGGAPRFLLMFAPKMALCLVGFIALAIKGWRERSMPRVAAVFLILAGVASLQPPFPPGVLLASIALFLISRSQAGSR